ncbi:MAG TPA: M20/M25/M40 family metallo-hydrolase [Pyrinomonadaceae bacterium]|nr:M20/M25/M40 family metallo-hydrolase [Pyrinomonadaceae bacterium]
MRRKIFALLSIIALAFAVALGQQPSASTSSVDRLRETVTYLASDRLEGRRTGTAGATEAANFIANEFKRLGLKPGATPTASADTRPSVPYLQPFPYVSSVELGAKNLLLVNPGKAEDIMYFQVGEDWAPLGFSTNGSISKAEMVFAGYGISSSELKYDDYAVSRAKDRVAIVFAGTPDGDNPHGQFAQAGQIRFKAAAARAAGARALFIISDEEKFKDDRLTRLSYDNAGEAGIPIVLISQNLASKLLGTADHPLSQYREAADARTAPTVRGLRSPSSYRTLSLETNVVRRASPSFNVVGILPGHDPKFKDEMIVIGAHYDHLGRGGEGSLAPREGEIHHGADDNASGTAALLELARRLSTNAPKPRRTIVFIAFSGEEEGLLGSDYYVNHPAVPLANTVAMINMDMIGRLQDRKLIIGGIGTAPEWRALVEAQNSVSNMANAALSEQVYTNMRVTLDPKISPAGFPIIIGANGLPVVTAEMNIEAATPFTLTLNEDGFGPSDHSSFYGKQIPVLFFWTGTHNDYHKPSDTSDKINYEGEAKIVSFVERIIRDIDKSDKRPTYTVAKSDPQQRTGFRVYLGTIPNYADSNDGLKIDGVRDESPAAKAGLKAGDKVVKLAGRDVKNVYDYTYALGEMKAGQEYEVVVMRESQRLTMKITPEARK